MSSWSRSGALLALRWFAMIVTMVVTIVLLDGGAFVRTRLAVTALLALVLQIISILIDLGRES